MSEVTCKMKCNQVVLHENGGEISMTPVTSGSDENAVFFRYTPYGDLKLGLVSGGTVDNFVPGQEYIVTFRKAD